MLAPFPIIVAGPHRFARAHIVLLLSMILIWACLRAMQYSVIRSGHMCASWFERYLRDEQLFDLRIVIPPVRRSPRVRRMSAASRGAKPSDGSSSSSKLGSPTNICSRLRFDRKSEIILHRCTTTARCQEFSMQAIYYRGPIHRETVSLHPRSTSIFNIRPDSFTTTERVPWSPQ